jgi:acetoin utilization deacetylase AcuC-like enzyme
MAPSKDRISYFYDSDVGTSYYGNNHPMKPHRLAMTHHLVLSYDLHKHLEVYVSTVSSRRPACVPSRRANGSVDAVRLRDSNLHHVTLTAFRNTRVPDP